MRFLTYSILFFAVFSCTNLGAQAEKEAQPELNPNALAAKLIFIDYGMTNPELGESKISNGLEITYLRNINRWMNIAVPAKLGLTTFAGDLNKTTLASVDAVLQFQYFNGRNRLVPYVFGGGGIVSENFSASNFQLPVGAGLNIELGKNSYVNLQAEYRKSNTEDRDNIQYGVGYMFRLGNTYVAEKENQKAETVEEVKDKDGDGVADKADLCPEVFGAKESNGCPDSDADGVPDPEDDCPSQAGTIEALGCPDSDKDGIADVDDDCPHAAGPLRSLGCPDSDNDGLADNEDDCPEVAGKKKFNGCPEEESLPEEIENEIDFAADDIADQTPQTFPERETTPSPTTPAFADADNDGVADTEDKCPNQAGSRNSQGCPDSDGDGFTDETDECPLTAGAFNGCPDTDRDGIHDAKDNCPEEAGTTESGGCPLQEFIADEDLLVLQNATQEVRFETGSDVLTTPSYEVLEKVRDAMMRYPNFRLMIEGHTDDVGDYKKNQLLSENRAKSCYTYLLANGVSPLSVQYIGYGESKPIADNKSKRGRELNRRVEFRLEMK